MFFQHVYDKSLAQASYFIGCQKAGVAAVIDPKRDVDTYLEIAKQNKNWVLLEEKVTDKNGRIGSFLKQDGKDNTGIYKLTFHTSPYFQRQGQKSFYPFIEVVFELTDKEHYHVPITVSPFGYSTYRGN